MTTISRALTDGSSNEEQTLKAEKETAMANSQAKPLEFGETHAFQFNQGVRVASSLIIDESSDSL